MNEVTELVPTAPLENADSDELLDYQQQLIARWGSLPQNLPIHDLAFLKAWLGLMSESPESHAAFRQRVDDYRQRCDRPTAAELDGLTDEEIRDILSNPRYTP